MTEKLYYKDAYMSDFEATVISRKREGNFFLIELDRTAFFPNEAGQPADDGYIDGVYVVDVIEREGRIYHLTKEDINVGSRVKCQLDFTKRFEKMQCHTAEHIVSGIIKKLFGYDNLGFHLSDDTFTFDVNGKLDREMLDRVEELANEAVYKNTEVKASFPNEDELKEMQYRSKLDILSDIRIVEIVGVDLCACCAPHVKRTGEIGLIKLLDFESHKGGVRINMTAGKRALFDYREKYRNVKEISALLSEKQESVAQGVEMLLTLNDNLKRKHKEAELVIAKTEADRLSFTEGNYVAFYPDWSNQALQAFVKLAVKKVSGMLVALTGIEGNYRYIIASESIDLKDKIANINEALSGRGGGKSDMMSGSFCQALNDIEKYFKTKEL